MKLKNRMVFEDTITGFIYLLDGGLSHSGGYRTIIFRNWEEFDDGYSMSTEGLPEEWFFCKNMKYIGMWKGYNEIEITA